MSTGDKTKENRLRSGHIQVRLLSDPNALEIDDIDINNKVRGKERPY